MKKPGSSIQAFFLVAGVDEISNFDLLKDLEEVIDFLKNKEHWAEEDLRIQYATII